MKIRKGVPNTEHQEIVAQAIRKYVDEAHRNVQLAQRLAYEEEAVPLRVRLGLNRVQNILVKLLVGRLAARSGTSRQAQPVGMTLIGHAAAYRGHWVLLGPSLEVIDSDLSPSALRNRHAAEAEAGNRIVFVPDDDCQADGPREPFHTTASFHAYMHIDAQLRRENEELRRELREQWEANHWEHCTNDWPHEGRCTWPPPDLLDTDLGGAA